jgi:hypothetical protein
MSTRPLMTVGHYELEAEIGRGAAGVVYRARDTQLDRLVAVKVLHRELAHDPGRRARFIAESRSAGRLLHPNILPVYEAGEDGEALFIVTPVIQGTDLSLAIADGPLDPDRSVRLVRQIASALDAAHEAGLVHRDVKPSNVLIERPGEGPERCYLADFGLVKALGDDPGLTSSGQFLGTLDYASPEQAEGRELDGRSDNYALGCVLYECLVGHVPFPYESAVAVLWAHVNERPPAPSAERSLPGALDGVLARALAKDLGDRFASAGELAQAAEAALSAPKRRRPVPRRPAASGQRERVGLRTRGLQVACGACIAGAGAIVATGPEPIDAVLLALLCAAAVSFALAVDATFGGMLRGAAPEPPEVWLDEMTERLAGSGWSVTEKTGARRRLALPSPARALLVVVFALCALVPALVYVILARRPQTIDLSAEHRRRASATAVRFRGLNARRAARWVTRP